MKAALLEFGKMESPSKTIILGDMLEVGKNTEEEHEGILNLVKHLKFDMVILVGKVFSTLNKNHVFRSFENSSDVAFWISENPLAGSSILIKGSRGIKLETIIPYL